MSAITSVEISTYQLTMGDLGSKLKQAAFQTASYLTDPICKSHGTYPQSSMRKSRVSAGAFREKSQGHITVPILSLAFLSKIAQPNSRDFRILLCG